MKALLSLDIAIRVIRLDDKGQVFDGPTVTASGTVEVYEGNFGTTSRVLRDGRTHAMPADTLRALLGEGDWQVLMKAIGGDS